VSPHDTVSPCACEDRTAFGQPFGAGEIGCHEALGGRDAVSIAARPVLAAISLPIEHEAAIDVRPRRFYSVRTSTGLNCVSPCRGNKAGKASDSVANSFPAPRRGGSTAWCWLGGDLAPWRRRRRSRRGRRWLCSVHRRIRPSGDGSASRWTFLVHYPHSPRIDRIEAASYFPAQNSVFVVADNSAAQNKAAGG
jgi:hypothetical protein